MLTWMAAYRSVSANKSESQKTDFCISGLFRYVRNRHYHGYFLLLAGLSSFQSRPGFPVIAIGETIPLLRLVGREEMQLEQEFGERYRDYQRCVPRLLFSFSPGLLPRASSHAGARPSGSGRLRGLLPRRSPRHT